MSVRIAVIYYSATGNVARLAEALAEGAATVDAEVRLRRVAELAPEAAIDSNPAWRAHYDESASTVAEARVEDLEWADGFAFGTPTRFGNVSSQLKQFIDQTGPLWMAGKLADKAASSFTSAINRHGGQESTLLPLNNTFYHWGAVIVAPGYTDPLLYAAGGNPYGTSFVAGMQGAQPGDEVLAATRYQGRRLAQIARWLAELRSERQTAQPAWE
jgi:NAD(P)H dehydrogenase (quinone)